MQLLKKLSAKLQRVKALERRIERLQEAAGRIEARQTLDAKTLREAEFRVFSQWGEDGIIQFLIRHVPIVNTNFVEFGVQNYLESNTRFLLVHNNWSGLVIDGSEENVRSIRRDEIYWQHTFHAECAFITSDNINELIGSHGLKNDIGLLSVDVDGNDYWIWKAIDIVSPRIVIVEYNSRFGAEKEVTIPYDPAFVRSRAHASMIYYGASLSALARLGEEKGYSLVGCNSAGNNAFFVRKDVQPASLPGMTAREAFIAATFREARDVAGNLSFLSFDEERKILETLPLVDLRK